jgi:hypothetical protein
MKLKKISLKKLQTLKIYTKKISQILKALKNIEKYSAIRINNTMEM